MRNQIQKRHDYWGLLAIITSWALGFTGCSTFISGAKYANEFHDPYFESLEEAPVYLGQSAYSTVPAYPATPTNASVVANDGYGYSSSFDSTAVVDFTRNPPPIEPIPAAMPSVAASESSSQRVLVANAPVQPRPAQSVPPNPAAYAPSLDDPFMPHPLPSLHPTLATPASPVGNHVPVTGFSGFAPSVSLEEAAQREKALAQERERRRMLATMTPSATKSEGVNEILQPMEPWNRGFTQRENREEEGPAIIPVSHREQSALVNINDAQTATEYFSQEMYNNEPLYDWEKEQKKTLDLSFLDPSKTYERARDAMGMGPDEQKAAASLEAGRAILRTIPDMKDAKQMLKAAAHFDEAAARWPDSVLAEDALHLAGECFFFSGYYPKAMLRYETIIVQYPHSKHLDNATKRLFVMAQYWEEEDFRGASFVNYRNNKLLPYFGTFTSAKKAWEIIFLHDAGGAMADDAVMALASAYYRRGTYQGDPNFDQAAYYFGYLRDNYPLSEHLTMANEFELYSRASSYLGASYSHKALSEAQELAAVTLRLNDGEMTEETRKEIVALQNTLEERQAEREWTLGQFYDKKLCFGTAKIYYEKIVAKFPHTEYAEKAAQRLAQIQNEPDQPDQLNLIKKIFRPRGTQ